MATTFDTFITRIRRIVKEEDASKSHWSDDLLKQLFNSQYLRRCAQLQMAFEGWFVLVAQRDIEANVARYSFPPNFQRLTKMELTRSDGRTIPIQRFERHGEVNPPPISGGDDYNPTWRLLANGFVLEPTPNTAVTNGLRIEYEGLPESLAGSNDTLHPSYPDQLESLLEYDTAVAMFDVEGVQESGQVRSLLRLRAEWEEDWERFIDRRVISRPGVTPFVAHYNDAVVIPQILIFVFLLAVLWSWIT